VDLIYTNADREDIGVLLDFELDLAIGKDENDFECSMAANLHCCELGSLLYMEGTEYGGIVDSIESDTANNAVIYSGRTWHGILNSKIIEPSSGQAYLTVSGEANTVIASLLSRLGLTELFEASSEDSGLNISGYQMNRYIEGYDGIKKMLKAVGGKLLFNYMGDKVVLSAVPIHDYSEDEEFDSDLIDLNIKKSERTVNHLICLGKGELVERTVIHLYADKNGTISHTQTYEGLAECVAVYDYPNVESTEELEAKGIEHLEKLWQPEEIKVDFSGDEQSFDIGDIVGGVDNITGISAATEITKKIVTIKNSKITISYEVGE
jgi:hypothetical protein